MVQSAIHLKLVEKIYQIIKMGSCKSWTCCFSENSTAECCNNRSLQPTLNPEQVLRKRTFLYIKVQGLLNKFLGQWLLNFSEVQCSNVTQWYSDRWSFNDKLFSNEKSFHSILSNTLSSVMIGSGSGMIDWLIDNQAGWGKIWRVCAKLTSKCTKTSMTRP